LRVLLPEDLQKRIERILDAFIKEGEEVREYSFWDSTKVKKEEDWFVHNCPICTSSELEEDLRRKKEVFIDPAFAEGLRDEMLAFLIAHEGGHRECLPKRGGDLRLSRGRGHVQESRLGQGAGEGMVLQVVVQHAHIGRE